MKDIVVIQSLQKRGVGLGDINEVLKYEAMERKPRVLDKAPKRLVMTKASDIKSYGCCSEFIMCFNELKSSNSLEQATINMRGVSRYCDVDVYYVLQALIKQGFNVTEDRAEACFDLFRVIMTTPGEVLTSKRVEDTLAKYTPINYYSEELLKGIYVVLFDEKLPVIHWMSICEYNGFYTKAFELGKALVRSTCDTEKDVERLLAAEYKQAKNDEEFMAKVYTQGANKWMMGLLYKLKEKHPEVMDQNTSDKGFA